MFTIYCLRFPREYFAPIVNLRKGQEHTHFLIGGLGFGVRALGSGSQSLLSCTDLGDPGQATQIPRLSNGSIGPTSELLGEFEWYPATQTKTTQTLQAVNRSSWSHRFKDFSSREHWEEPSSILSCRHSAGPREDAMTATGWPFLPPGEGNDVRSVKSGLSPEKPAHRLPRHSSDVGQPPVQLLHLP